MESGSTPNQQITEKPRAVGDRWHVQSDDINVGNMPYLEQLSSMSRFDAIVVPSMLICEPTIMGMARVDTPPSAWAPISTNKIAAIGNVNEDGFQQALFGSNPVLFKEPLRNLFLRAVETVTTSGFSIGTGYFDIHTGRTYYANHKGYFTEQALRILYFHRCTETNDERFVAPNTAFGEVFKYDDTESRTNIVCLKKPAEDVPIGKALEAAINSETPQSDDPRPLCRNKINPVRFSAAALDALMGQYFEYPAPPANMRKFMAATLFCRGTTKDYAAPEWPGMARTSDKASSIVAIGEKRKNANPGRPKGSKKPKPIVQAKLEPEPSEPDCEPFDYQSLIFDSTLRAIYDPLGATVYDVEAEKEVSVVLPKLQGITYSIIVSWLHQLVETRLEKRMQRPSEPIEDYVASINGMIRSLTPVNRRALIAYIKSMQPTVAADNNDPFDCPPGFSLDVPSYDPSDYESLNDMVSDLFDN